MTGGSGSIGQTVEPIVPAVLRTRAGIAGKAPPNRDLLLDAAVRENARRVVQRLRTAEAMRVDPLRTKKLLIVGARYGLDDGAVEFFDT